MDLFDNIEKQKELKIILDSWLNTPFRHHCGVKGRGCDCIHFALRVFQEMGILNVDDKRIPIYPRDWHLHNTRELLAEAIEKYCNVKKFKITKTTPSIILKNGDILLSHYGKAASHAGIYFDGYAYQSITNVGVCKINFKDKVFKRQMRFAYRIKE